MTGKPQAGTVSLVLFDPMTEKVISTQKQKFSLAAGKTMGVDFQFIVSDKYEIVGCRMIADSGTSAMENNSCFRFLAIKSIWWRHFQCQCVEKKPVLSHSIICSINKVKQPQIVN